MRARSLKPALFKNEDLGSADPLYTILFEGLWCLADREGRLEDRPMRICAELFPYRRQITERKLDAMLDWLLQRKMVIRYVADGKRLIQVTNFVSHQNPHKNEAPSKYQAPTPNDSGASTRLAPERVDPKTEALGLTPSSLTPDSGLLTPDYSATGGGPSPGGKGKPTTDFDPIEFSPLTEWAEWIEFRRGKRWPNDRTTLRKQIRVLEPFDAATQAEIINNSIQAGWQGLFPPKGGANGRRDDQPRKTRYQQAIDAIDAATNGAVLEGDGRDDWPPLDGDVRAGPVAALDFGDRADDRRPDADRDRPGDAVGYGSPANAA